MYRNYFCLRLHIQHLSRTRVIYLINLANMFFFCPHFKQKPFCSVIRLTFFQMTRSSSPILIFFSLASMNYIDEDITNTPLSTSTRLIILVVFDIPSLLCTIFILFHLLNNSILRKSIYNHVITALLFNILPTHVMDIPFVIIYLSTDYVWPADPECSQFWSFVAVWNL